MPVKVTSVEGTVAKVEMSGVSREVSIVMLPETRVGDYILVHAGFAIQRVDEQEALETLRMFEQIANLVEQEGTQRGS